MSRTPTEATSRPLLVPAVILAGGRSKPDLAALTGQEQRALVVVEGKTLLRHVVDAVSDAQRAQWRGAGNLHEGVAAGDEPSRASVVVVGDMAESADYTHLPDSGSFVANLFSGVRAFAQAPYVLVATSDLPFVTGDMVRAFVTEAVACAQQTDAAMIWPIVPVAECYARFPGIRRTALRLREGEYTGGNLALVRPEFLLQHEARISAVYSARKSPLRLAMMLGPGTVARLLGSLTFFPRLLSIPFLEERASRLLGTPLRALPCHCPELATDLDRPSDFQALGFASFTPPGSL